MMRLIPYEKFYIRSSLNQDEVASRMGRATLSRMGILWFWKKIPQKFIGKVEKSSFSIRTIRGIDRTHPVIEGKIEPTIGGTQITITFQPSIPLWVNIVGIIGVCIYSLLDPLLNLITKLSETYTFSPLFLVFAGIALLSYLEIMVIYNIDAKKTKSNLLQILEAQEQDAPLE
jgi:hypothetical protein